jgi:glutamate formiminotransferase/formiminotetrahydrofolate cyclodeaminase
VAALAGALAGALAQMVAGLTIGKKKYAAVESEMKEIALQAAALVNELSSLIARDATAYAAVTAAYKLPGETPADAARKTAATTAALLHAAEVPLETGRACVRVLELTAALAARGNRNAVSDAGVAALLADAACRGAVYNVRINVSALDDKAKGARLVEEAGRLLSLAAERLNAVTTMVERSLT